MKKLKDKRDWLEDRAHSNSYYDLRVGKSDWEKGEVDLTLADCNRRIAWHFGKPGEKRAIAKIKKVKALIDSIYEHLVPEDQR